MLKRLILINGVMGAGKSSTTKELKRLMPPSVFLDGDWCWDMHPFMVNDETKLMVMRNASFLLNSYIECSVFENIIFCWVMDKREIVLDLLGRLKMDGNRVYLFTIALSEAALTKRLAGDISTGIRDAGILTDSIERLRRFSGALGAEIDASAISPYETAVQIADEIARIDECGGGKALLGF